MQKPPSHHYVTKRTTTLIAGVLMTGLSLAAQAETLLNVSYDPTREFYSEFNRAFNLYWQQQGNEPLTIQQSHGGSSKQARSVVDGLRADVVTLALAGDIDELHRLGKLVPADWQSRLPDASSPYTSTIVFLVRKGNPKNIRDWDDLVGDDVAVITPNPKTSGGARWNFLAAWAYAKQQYGSDDAAIEFTRKLYRNVPILDTGARGATNTFAQNQIGDVLLAWENEAFLTLREHGADAFEIIVPSLSILAEPAVSLVDRNVDRKGSRAAAEAYLNYLYSDEGQRIAAKNFYRPRNPAIAAEFHDQFPALSLVTIDGEFGGWQKAHTDFFAENALFDQIYLD